MRRLKAVIEYDGTDFAGWQVQPDSRTVQGVLEDVLYRRFDRKIALTGAGRTDAGVHAAGQTAHFDCPGTDSAANLRRSLESMLPDDISLRSLEEVPRDFHARYDAFSRSYRYEISLAPSALKRRFCWEYTGSLDAGRMRRALLFLPGTHDFMPFSKLNTRKNHYRCTIFEASLKKKTNHITLRFRADRFLHGMIRAIVGTAVDIGRGAKESAVIETILTTGDRSLVGGLAPARGLFLEHIHYAQH